MCLIIQTKMTNNSIQDRIERLRKISNSGSMTQISVKRRYGQRRESRCEVNVSKRLYILDIDLAVALKVYEVCICRKLLLTNKCFTRICC